MARLQVGWHSGKYGMILQRQVVGPLPQRGLMHMNYTGSYNGSYFVFNAHDFEIILGYYYLRFDRPFPIGYGPKSPFIL